MATRRNIIDSTHPNSMTSEQRRCELSALLARGVMRFLERRQVISEVEPGKPAEFDGNCLEVVVDFCPDGHRG